MSKLRANNPGLCFLISYWSRYCTLGRWHTDWAKQHIRVPDRLRKGQALYLEGERQRNVYLVARGLLARVRYDDRGKRQILSIALPGMALMTTDHLYSSTASLGDIVVLRPQTLVIQISYSALKDFKEQEPHIDTLMDILGNKKRKQMARLRIVDSINDSVDRYTWFADHINELHLLLTQQEMAELLGMSKASIKRANKRWLNS